MPPKRRPRARGGGVQPPPSSVARVCNEGNCRYGEKSKFLHSATQGDEPAVPSAAAATVDVNTTLIPLQTSYGVTDLQAPVIEAEPAIEGDVTGQGLAAIEGQYVPILGGSLDTVERTVEPHSLENENARPLPVLGPPSRQAIRSSFQPGSATTIPELSIQGACPASLPMGGKTKKTKPCFAFRGTGKCRKGDLCAYVHDINANPNGQGIVNGQGGISPQAAADLQQLAGLAQDKRQRQVEELRKKVGEGTKHERTERERLGGERLEMERVERERLERERLAREREKVLQEQEVKRRHEAKVTLQFVIQGSNLVTFGPGLGVRRVVPGFDLCKVVISNLPGDATDEEVINIFKEQGLDEAMFKLLERREEGGGNVAKFLTRRKEAETVAIGLEGLEFRDNLLAFEVEDNTARGSMKSSASGTDANTLTFFWSAPSVVMVATYETVEEARRKVGQLNRRQFGSRSITATLNPMPNGPAARSWVEASVKLGNFPPGTNPFDVFGMAGTTNVMTIQSSNYDQAMFVEQLKLYLSLDGPVADSFSLTEPQAGTGLMKGTAQFPSQDALKRATGRLNHGVQGWWPDIQVSEQHQYCISISNAQYRAQKSQWDSMTKTERRGKAFVRIREKRKGRSRVFQVNVEGPEEKEVGELKVRVESLAAGERLGAEHWHSTYAYSGGALCDRVKEETNVLVKVDRRFQALRLFGASNDLPKAKDIIRQETERLELMEYTIPIERRSVRFFVATGLPILQESLGEDNVTLDVGSRQCSLKLRGGDDAIKHAQRLVEEAVTAARGGLPVPVQTGDEEGSPCPICYDTPTHPEVLSCGHSCCEPCLRHYISSAATSDTFPLVCMGNNATCNTRISVPIIHRYLTQQRFTVLVEAAFASYIQTNSQKFKYCTTPDCTQIYQCDTGKQVYQCPACFSRICSSCNEEAHEGMTCEQRRVQSDPAEQDRLNNEWAQSNNIKRCPTCSVMTEKTEGCNHMTCRCGAHWCWICGLPFEAHTIYDHMQTAHGGIHGEPAHHEEQQRREREAEAQRQARVAEQVRLAHAQRAEEERRRRERGAAFPRTTNFNVKRCPGCTTLTEKDGEHNHILCRCGTHWCWVCRRAFDRATIYTHITTVHGGMGLPVAGEAGGQPANQGGNDGWFDFVEEDRRRRQREADEGWRTRLEEAERERERLAAAHRERQRQMAEEAARREAQKDDSWCVIM